MIKNICLVLLIAFCSINQLNAQKFFNLSDDRFKGRFSTFFDEGEVEIRSWYHYVVTRKDKKNYILREFYMDDVNGPQITAEVRFDKKSLKNREGQATYWHENGYKAREGLYADNKQVALHIIQPFFSRQNGSFSLALT